jgi:hypothetical protein
VAREGRKTTFWNLIDIVLALEEEKSDRAEVFLKILIEYFFKEECNEKKFFAFLKGFELPSLFSQTDSITSIDTRAFENFVNGTSPADSLCGKIMLSKAYLKTFQQNHQPEFKKLPTDVQMTLLDEIKNRNAQIIKAFGKMHEDREADKTRTILRLVALILKNIQIRTGLPFGQMKGDAGDEIRNIFRDADSVFEATAAQKAEMTDDKNIKALIKVFFVIRKNQDLSDIAEHFRAEFERYKKRAEKIFK